MAATRTRDLDTTALVLGSDVIGSATAHALHVAGWDVVLMDDIDPPGPWRGMSFVNAWYFGSAELGQVAACFCSSVKSIPSALHRQNLIAATSWSWRGVAASLMAEAVVDTRTADGGRPDNLRARAPDSLVTIGCGPGFVAGEDVDFAVDTSFDGMTGTVMESGATCTDLGRRPPLGGAGDDRFVHAPRDGRMRTQFRVGEMVQAGTPLGDVNGTPLIAPLTGVLRGLSSRGARVHGGQTVAEVDPRGDPKLCYGMDPRGAHVAAGVLHALSARGLVGRVAAQQQGVARRARL